MVYAVRETTIGSLKRIIRQFGSEWALSSGIIERLLSIGQHRNYLRRLTLLFALGSICSVVSISMITDTFLPMMESLSADPIANVRFNVAKTFEAMVPVLLAADQSALVDAKILPILQQLERDLDQDVQDFALRALKLVPS